MVHHGRGGTIVQPAKTRQYRPHEFAKIAGITVRTLHHYDRLGLLRARRSAGGYRLYGDGDLDTLRLIRILKYVGFPLQRIKALLPGNAARLAEPLRTQRQTLQKKHAELDQAIGAIAELQRTLDAERGIGSDARQRIMDAIAPLTAEARRNRQQYALAARIDGLKDNIERMRRFAVLCAEIESAIDENPSSARAQALADRWADLSGGPGTFDPRVLAQARQMFAQAFAEAPDLRQLLPRLTNPAVLGFVQQALDATARAT
jgi:MerR family transcriptional regulator, thiopeptide resistance regulator